MDFIATRVNELLSKVSPIKRWLISDVANEYYRGQKLVYRNVLKGSALREFIEILNHCGIKLSYNLRKVSVRTDQLTESCYKNEQNKRTVLTRAPLEEQYKSIMENFDKVLEYMQWDKSHREYDDEGRCIGKSTWKMYVGPNEHRVPTLYELSRNASVLLREVMKLYNDNKSPYLSIATGPFKVICRYGMLELIACLETWSYD